MANGGLRMLCVAAALLLGGASAGSLVPECADGKESGSCNLPAAVARPAARIMQGTALMQVSTEVAKSAEARLLARAAAQKRSAATAAVASKSMLRRGATDVAAALQKGLEAIRSSLQSFQAETPDIPGGISTLGTALMECIDLVITEEAKESWDAYPAFREAWQKAFKELPETAASIREDLEKFTAEGQLSHLISAVSQILEGASDTVLNLVPGGLGRDISQYLEALKNAFGSVGEALVAFEEGNTLGGVEAVYFGLRNASETIIPESLRDNEVYSVVVGTLDNVVSGLSEDIIEYKNRLAGQDACWKQTQSRRKTHPSVCPERFHWDGERHCYPEEERECWQAPPECVANFEYDGKRYSNCTDAKHKQPWCAHHAVYQWRKWSNCEKVPCSGGAALLAADLDKSVWGKLPKGVIPAKCDDSDTSEFREKHDGWCYADCADGYEAFSTKCKTLCQGAYPAAADRAGLCGRNQDVLNRVMTEMALRSANSAISLAFGLSRMHDEGVDAEKLGHTFQILIDAGKPFALRKCPEP